MPPNDEITIWENFCAGDEKSLFALYNLFYFDLLRYGIGLTTDAALTKDFINRLFLDLWQKRDKLPVVRSPKAFLITCLRNKLLYRKKGKTDRLVFNQANTDYHQLADQSIEAATAEIERLQEQQQQISQLLNGLSQRQREIINLRFFEELSYEDIAQKLGISVRTVYNSIHESIKLLKASTDQRPGKA
jgi:RNA polymerase sigma factor (sigma-70 family)